MSERLVVLALAASDALAAQRASGSAPSRIVSLDYRADQFVLKLVDRDGILVMSPDATQGFSYMREAAVGLPTARFAAGDVLVRTRTAHQRRR